MYANQLFDNYIVKSSMLLLIFCPYVLSITKDIVLKWLTMNVNDSISVKCHFNLKLYY